jgi:DNA-binding LacI/PurR family transcriptional regulator
MNAVSGEKRAKKAEQLTEALLVMAQQRGPGIKLPTLQELCLQFDVAGGTLERALTPLEQRGLLCRKHGSGIYVSPTIHQKAIGVVFGGNIFDSVHYSPFWLLLLQAVRQQVAERKHQPLAYLDISQSSDGLGGHAHLIEDLENRRLHGLLLLAPFSPGDEARQLGSYGVPLVVFGGHAPEWTVTHDWRPVFSLAARELAMRGCRRVAILGQTTDRDRQQLEHDLREDGYEGDPVLDWSYPTWARRILGPLTRETLGRELARLMIADRANLPLPDGVVSLDDTMTRGVITALQEAGLQPGRDIHIATVVNKGSPVLEPYTSNLIQIEYDPAADVHAALDMLDILMNGGKPPQNPVLIVPTLRNGRGAEDARVTNMAKLKEAARGA